MRNVHSCELCGWQRVALSLTMVEPLCPSCGGLLSSQRATAEAAPAPALRGGKRPLGALIRLSVVCAVLYVAVRAGYDAGGFWIATVAAGVSGLTLVSLIVPEAPTPSISAETP